MLLSDLEAEAVVNMIIRHKTGFNFTLVAGYLNSLYPWALLTVIVRSKGHAFFPGLHM